MSFRTSGRGKDAGATLVEAAIVLPILLLVIFAILELGLAFKDYLTVSYLSREGARIGGLAGNDPGADCAILVGIGALATSGDLDRIDEIRIFKADPGTGNPGVTNVARYTGLDPSLCTPPGGGGDNEGWVIDPIAWPSTDRQIKVGNQDLDIIGVRIVLNRSWITGFPPFRGDMTVDETTITRLEPKVYEQ